MNDFGWNDHVGGRLNDDPIVVLDKQIKRAIDDLRQIEAWWNLHAVKRGLPIKLSVKKVVRRLEDGDYASFTQYFARSDDSGVLHETQIITVIDIIVKALENPDKSGLTLGALQGGKTLTAVALQWLGPVSYLLTGKKVKPIYLITSQTSHEDQAKFELERFVNWYGDIELLRNRQLKCSLNSFNQLLLDSMFERLPTLRTYRDRVLSNFEQGDFLIDHNNFIHRRVHGKAVGRIAEICRKANEKGIEPVLILDEAQNGAGDQDVPDKKTGRHRRKCVLRQILDAITEQCKGLSARYIAVSATPFELFDVSSGELPHVWRAHLALSTKYVGFNFFGGELICDGVEIKTPDIRSFEMFGDEIDIPLFADGHFDAAIWAMHHKINLTFADVQQRFARWAKKNHYHKSYDDYIGEFEDGLHTAIMHLAERDDEPTGICIRLCNNNAITRAGIASLDFDRTKIEVLEFFTDKENDRPQAGSVKRFLQEHRKHLDLPYVMFVTNKARMGDAFPANVKYFIECSFRATNLNSLLQGLLGRACGYGKETMVIVSRENDIIVDDWMATRGGHVYPTSRYTIPVKLRRGPRTNMVKLTTDMDDPIVKTFFERVETDIIDKMLMQGSPALKPKNRSRTTRTGPILKIADELGLFEYVEENHETLFPNLRMPIKIARVGDKVVVYDKDGNKQTQEYYIDQPGWCAFTFRDSESARGGRAGRGKHDGRGNRDSKTDRARVAGRLEPQINVEKFNPRTGLAFDDRHDEHGNRMRAEWRKPGNWRAHMVTLPLVNAVHEVLIGEAAYPVAHSPFAEHMTHTERSDRDDEIEDRAKRRKRRT